MKLNCFINKINIKVYSILLIISLLLVLIFNNSFYWQDNSLNSNRIVVYIISVLVVLVIPVLLARMKKVQAFVLNMKEAMRNLYDNPKIVLAVVVSYFVVGLLAYGCTIFFEHIHYNESFNEYRFLFFLVLCWLLLTYLWIYKYAENTPQLVFLVTILLIGAFFVKVSPCVVGVAWDDGIHYERTLNVSNYLNHIMYEADINNINGYNDHIENHLGYDRISKAEYSADFQESYENRRLVEYSFEKIGIYSVAYLPAALGIVLGRGLGFSYDSVFMMGKLMNLLLYACLIYYSIKKVKYGKVFIAVLGLIPTFVFIAGSYSYDAWVIGFIILGYSYLFSELQKKENGKNIKNLVLGALFVAIGCIPKAIYFPLLFPFLFAPIVEKKLRMRYILAIIFIGLCLVMTFITPLFAEPSAYTDTRGGTDVNSQEQILFVISHPLSYIKILYGFYKSYLAINSIGYGFQHFSYMGYGMFWGIIVVILVFVAALDRDEKKSTSLIMKVAGVVACVGTLILMTTALYVSFTAVASNTVAGMHDRYVFPLLYPFIYFIGIDGIKMNVNRKLFVCVPMLIIALTFLYNINMLCVTQY